MNSSLLPHLAPMCSALTQYAEEQLTAFRDFLQSKGVQHADRLLREFYQF